MYTYVLTIVMPFCPAISHSGCRQDPDVLNAAAAGDDLEVYNPFDNSSAPSYGSAYDAVDEPADAVQPDASNGKSSSSSSGSGSKKKKKSKKDKKKSKKHASNDDEDVSWREANLEQREAKLLEREYALEKRMREYRTKEGANNNWPFACYAVAYHNIGEEIPVDDQSLVRKFYVLVIMTWICLFWNWICILALWFDSETSVGDTQAFWATLYLAFGLFGSWKLWYRSFYYGFRDRSSKTLVFGFINFFCHIGFSIVMAMGIPATAGAGLFIMISALAKDSGPVSILVLFAMLFWGINVMIGIYLLKAAHTKYQTMGGAAAAKKEVASDAASAIVESKMEDDDVI